MRCTVRSAVEKVGPFYIRLGRGEIPRIFEDRDDFQIGKARHVSEGSDVGIVAAGFLLQEAIEAGSLLQKEGIKASILDMHTVKPVDESAVTDIARRTAAIVTVEDHNILGGLGSAVAEIACRGKPVPIEMVGIHDRFGESGELRELMEIHGLTSHHIADAAKRVMKLKDGRDR
jgi:transketolase